MTALDDFLSDPNDYICPHCGKDASVRGLAGPSLGVACNDVNCEGFTRGGVMSNLTPVVTDSETYTFVPPKLWVDGESREVIYRCPDCESTEAVERVGHDDGQGLVDVEVRCSACEIRAWE